MQKGKFGIIGGKQLERKLGDLDAKIRSKIARLAVRESAKPVQAAAKASAPVLTGLLKSSIVIRTQKKKTTIRAVVSTSEKQWLKKNKPNSQSTGKRELFYAHFYEFGTRHQPARPFMRPAFDRNKERAAEIMMGVLRREIAKEGHK